MPILREVGGTHAASLGGVPAISSPGLRLAVEAAGQNPVPVHVRSGSRGPGPGLGNEASSLPGCSRCPLLAATLPLPPLPPGTGGLGQA